MRAAVIRKAGGPEVLGIEEVPVPKPQPGEVLIRVKAFGLNRSELFTRLGQSPSVKFPRILGIEACWFGRRGAGKRVQQGRYRGYRDGRHGTAVRRRLRRVYLRSGNASAGDRDQT